MKVYQKIASRLAAIENCRKTGNDEWLQKHMDAIKYIVQNQLPSGSGWDCGTKLVFEKCTPEKLVFTGSYHHMDQSGFYTVWTDHTIVVKPSLSGEIFIAISGTDRNDIKEYLHEIFLHALLEDADVVKTAQA